MLASRYYRQQRNTHISMIELKEKKKNNKRTNERMNDRSKTILTINDYLIIGGYTWLNCTISDETLLITYTMFTWFTGCCYCSYCWWCWMLRYLSPLCDFSSNGIETARASYCVLLSNAHTDRFSHCSSEYLVNFHYSFCIR